MNLNLKHWTGTAIVALIAGFVIFGLLKGQDILKDFLKSDSPAANLEKGEIFYYPINQTPNLSTSLVITSKNPTPIPTLISALTPTPSKTSTPSLAPVKTPIPISTSNPGFTYTSTPMPEPAPSPTLSPISTSIPTPTPTSMPTPSPTPNSGFVIINEIAWMGTLADTNDEWIEIYNTDGQTINLTGWTIKATDGTPDITLSGTIGPYGFYLLERTDDGAISDISADQTFTGAIENGGEYLELRDAENNLRDSVDGSPNWFEKGDNTTKSSMERINPNQSGSDSANWQTNQGVIKNGHDKNGDEIRGTPRQPNGI